MADFQINGVDYQSKLMDGETQTFVLKRMLPAFTALIGATPKLNGAVVPKAEPVEGDDEAEEVEDTGNRMHDLLMPVARELAALTDKDVGFILNACLDVTSRRAAGGGIGWAAVRQKGMLQDQNDAKFKTRLTIAWHVLGENFGQMLASFGLDMTAIAAAAPKIGLG